MVKNQNAGLKGGSKKNIIGFRLTKTSKNKMFLWLTCLALLGCDGCDALSQKLALLTQPCANVLFLCQTIFRQSAVTWNVLLWFFSLNENLPALALTNTLFIIHPALLYASFSSSLYKLHRRPREASPYVYLVLGGIAISLGGFWSMQELNWGGWWNWDVLEVGSAFVWACFVLSLHLFLKKTSATLLAKQLFCWSISLFYYFLNKTGIGTSVHSFVTSKSLKTNFASALLVALILINVLASKAARAGLFFFFLLYLNTSNANSLKQTTLALLIFLKPHTPKTSHKRAQHRVLIKLALFFVIINYNNKIIATVEKICTNIFFCNFFKRVQFKITSALFLIDNAALSKPKLVYSGAAQFVQSRSIGDNVNVLAYKK